MNADSVTTANTTAQKSGLWIYNPPLDLIVGCGAWSAPLLLLTYFATNSTTLAWSVAFYALALVFNFPHYMATIYRVYHTREDFEKYRIFTVHITALIVLSLLASHFWYAALPWILTLYLTWSPWHYSGQNYGLFVMFTRRAGAAPSNAERRALHAAFFVSYLVLFVNFHTGVSHDPMFVSLGIPARIGDLAVMLLGGAFVGCAIFGLRRLPGQVGWRPLLPALTLFSTQFIWFLLPTVLSLGGRLQIPQSRYSTGVLAIMHSAQYLWITSYYARREAQAKTAGWRPLVYFAILVTGGIALFIPGPWLASRVFHYDFTASFLIFTALVNIHHFILDGAIWKLRDGRIAALLLIPQAGLNKARKNVVSGAHWILSSSSTARTIRIVAACGLLTLAIVDQTRYYLALHREDLADLRQAEVLNSFDSSLQSRIAKKELELGDSEAAVAAWKEAVSANPADTDKRDVLLKFLTDHQRFAEAYAIAEMCAKKTPSDANLLANEGILASQLGHPDIALSKWIQAVASDASQTQAELYIAQELQREGKVDAAVPYYVTYLNKVSAGGVSKRPTPANIITVVLQLAECQAHVHNISAAERSYELAESVARSNNEKKLESFAEVSHAALAADQSDMKNALRLYQSALNLDAEVDDRRGEATDWYNYAMFLKKAGYPARLVYASLTKSEETASGQTNDNDQVLQIASARQDEAIFLSKGDAGVQSHPQTAIAEALTIAPK